MSSRSLSEGVPCPGRIVVDAGAGFAVGAVGGSVFHFIKGTYNSPNGGRFTGGMQALRMNAPRIGGSFAVWGGLFSTFHCTAVYARQKDDPWNSIFSGAATGGLLSARQGLRAAGRSAVIGGALLALMEGMIILTNRAEDEQAKQNRAPVHQPNWIANRLRAAGQQDLPQVDDPILSAAVSNRAHGDDPTVAAGGGGFQGSRGGSFAKEVEETKKPDGNGGEF